MLTNTQDLVWNISQHFNTGQWVLVVLQKQDTFIIGKVPNENAYKPWWEHMHEIINRENIHFRCCKDFLSIKISKKKIENASLKSFCAKQEERKSKREGGKTNESPK